ncbi:hypothetical protein BXZ70DRAFT_1007188 [Cristinia sonorae]|uniref:BTB domain-containing protein n=1 Tax=Cristinia sonorae TaxID=1940300 RepID=A0A8K0URS4_9AGAR|nr:hypothetical protein BXZ70DRAFT_1007188 [Cristinia sonorae]
MSDTPVAKRPRMDEVQPAQDQAMDSQPEYQRGDIWFEDGNVVLIAQDTTFRVHRGVLSNKSDVFSGMFSVPQPENMEMLDGCPAVHLSDSKDNLTHMLLALYNGDRYFDLTVPLPFHAVSAMLQLGSKYQIDELKRAAVHRLQRHIPSHLEDFVGPYRTLPSRGDPLISDFVDEHAIAVIDLAWRHELHALLPPAFYACAQLRSKALAEGFTDPAGVHWKLSRKDLWRCLEGQRSLRTQLMFRMQFLWDKEVSPTCAQSSWCKERLVLERGRTVTIQLSATVYRALEDSGWIETLQLCKPCTDHFVWMHDGIRQDSWRRLARMFQMKDIVTWPVE